jgi:ssDNA-binding Zn-finger/Zn-ribbon topoisomerase 1
MSIEETLCPKCKSKMKSVKGNNGRYWLCSKLGCGGTRDSMGRSQEDRWKEKERSDFEDQE